MNLALKLDRIAARAEELRAMLSAGAVGRGLREGLAGSFRRSNRWWRGSANCAPPKRARHDAETLLADPEMRELAEAELRELKERIPTLQHEIRSRAAAEG